MVPKVILTFFRSETMKFKMAAPKPIGLTDFNGRPVPCVQIKKSSWTLMTGDFTVIRQGTTTTESTCVIQNKTVLC